MEVAVKEQRQQKALSVFSFWKYKKCFPHLDDIPKYIQNRSSGLEASLSEHFQ